VIYGTSTNLYDITTRRREFIFKTLYPFQLLSYERCINISESENKINPKID